MTINIGDVVYMDYGFGEVHTRVVLAPVDPTSFEWVILTPDLDIYTEILHSSNPDLNAFYNMGPGGALPRRVPRNQVYGFAPMAPHDLARHMGAGRQEASAERQRRGLGGGQAAVPGAVAAAGPVAGGVVGGAAAPMAAPVNWYLAEMVEGHKVGESVQVPPNSPMMDDHALVRMTDAAGKTRPVLVKRLAPEDLAAFCEERVKLCRACEAAEGEDQFAADDCRTMQVTYNANGERHKGFKDAIGDMVEVSFDDFPLEPRTCLEYLRAVSSVGESCYSQHLAWVQQARIPDNNRAIYEDEILSRILDTCICYDCLNPANLACMELVVRRRQLIAQAHALNPSAPSYDGADLFLGSQYRAGGGIVVPTLKEHVSKGLHAESQILKERRKLQEARGRGSGGGGSNSGGPQKGGGRGRGEGAAGN